ncbi:hypothetical protein DAPPUDRAFT_242117 [Daphnia pulex]|uniref:Uncharacterized protein n=1 Tax=Daphnia pulex TaxID=6669 RepID=E9GFX2_DAPPU|nr:hypothetical protein DAPPUDRAFT_242117 [Daphnia pulex]|eukprot:EFX81713.1 hypothetical protein DAPPUDRAFT_242117 [Daphnia pulex]
MNYRVAMKHMDNNLLNTMCLNLRRINEEGVWQTDAFQEENFTQQVSQQLGFPCSTLAVNVVWCSVERCPEMDDQLLSLFFIDIFNGDAVRVGLAWQLQATFSLVMPGGV